LTVSRAEAKAADLVRYFTGLKCKHGHTAERFTSTGQCVVCVTEHAKKWHKQNRDKINLASRERTKRKPKKKRKPSKTRQEIQRAYVKRKKLEASVGPPKPKTQRPRKPPFKYTPERKREKWQEYYSNNLAKMIAKAATRRSRQMKSCPDWLSKEQHVEILNIYKQCRAISKSTGIPHHVDHIIPLCGKTVCGLHVPWNLNVIPASENMKKKNRLIE
jgi:hypothetical protein